MSRRGLEPPRFTAEVFKTSAATDYAISTKPPLLRAKGKTKKFVNLLGFGPRLLTLKV